MESSLDLNQYVSATPAVTEITFQSSYTKPTWLSLTGGVLSGNPPSGTYDEATSLTVLLAATNAESTTNLSLPVNITIAEEPAFVMQDITLQVAETGSVVYNLAEFIMDGFPFPVITLKAGGAIRTGLTPRF